MYLLHLLHLLFTLTLATVSIATPTAAAGAGAAASTPTSSSDSSSPYVQCAENILEACLNQMKPEMDNCNQNDWSCLCTQSKNILTCYNDCPSSPNHAGAVQQKIEYCNAAEANSLYSTTTSSMSVSSTSTAATETTSSSEVSRTAAASAVKSSGAAVAIVAGGGGGDGRGVLLGGILGALVLGL
ncbi:GPI anchored serine-threonine rich protein [Aspergillus ibericus CBS 121593]|uniref:GPI anchored serine-threonine rich protein n=1 Tax=Aspergillus ibericus CBS 121593 TaxID=1448316 RepID=A0A395GY78_9EURO|nr:hypothetical protein BO80DRAFT_104943 [Aspergillus ibericus CBS 121593]RAL00300.1 hypothetical protein BO80DRAFT_104943 [Aspergillus ibericus CBS 121593]